MIIKRKYPDWDKDFGENLLRARGFEDVDRFLNPEFEDVGHYNDIPNMSEALHKVRELFDVSEKINYLLIVDSDADGFMSSTILHNYLHHNGKEWGAKSKAVCHEGKQHGAADIEKIEDFGFYDVVFLPDAGTNDTAIYEKYPETFFVVLDHHESEDYRPLNNTIVANPHLEGSNYKNLAISGTGVTWQFCRGLYEEFGIGPDPDTQYDLVTFATIGDMLNITTPENRYFLSRGLNEINNKFLMALVEKQSYSLNGDITPIGIAFYISPLINAMCRSGTMSEKINMMTAFFDGDTMIPCKKRGSKPGAMEKASIESAREATNARSRQKSAQEKMSNLVYDKIYKEDLLENKVLIIGLDENTKIPSTINGLTANVVSNEHGRPVIVGKVSDGYLKGSARGMPTIGIDSFKDFALESGYVDFAQGHGNAFGISIPLNKIDSFQDWANERLKDVDVSQKAYDVDFITESAEKKAPEIVSDLWELRHTFGDGNPEPLIYTENVSGAMVKVVGSNSNTIQIILPDITYVIFRRTPEEVEHITSFVSPVFNLLGRGTMNFYNDKATPQIIVTDYEVSEGLLMF